MLLFTVYLGMAQISLQEVNKKVENDKKNTCYLFTSCGQICGQTFVDTIAINSNLVLIAKNSISHQWHKIKWYTCKSQLIVLPRNKRENTIRK